ncbi:Concanavalin A-like lectin/glucanase, subgroup [Artemisia annua]|uniref:Concanavalin A-like lectin/glucanase, subgroup n=1 Tax=Artemisia annua TaxID=35608 RepID=A0A2U1M4D1_ARTAN|nr:Concanavalin A-like lectin/glucanase, subgroup [Artemisia annua]
MLPPSSYYHGPTPENALAFEPSSLNFEPSYQVICLYTLPYLSQGTIVGNGIFVSGVAYWGTTGGEFLGFYLKNEIYGVQYIPYGEGGGLSKKRYASLKLTHPIHGMTQTGRKRESKNNKPLSSLPTKSTSTSSSNPTQISNSSSMINRCNHRILTGNNPQAASHHSNSNEVAETINMGVNLSFDISGKDRDIASIIGSGDHDDIK